MSGDKVPVTLFKPSLCGCGRGKTKVLDGAYWVKCSEGFYPDYGITCDKEAGWPILLARCDFERGILPGKFHVGYHRFYVASCGKERIVDSYEILVTEDPEKVQFYWVPSSNGKLVKNAVVGGRSVEGETLFIGRVSHMGHKGLTWVPGSVQPSVKTACIPWGQKQWCSKEYEILVGVQKDGIPPKPDTTAGVLLKENWKKPSDPEWTHRKETMSAMIGDGTEMGVDTEMGMKLENEELKPVENSEVV